MTTESSIEELKTEVVEKVEELADATGAPITAEATAQVAVTAAAIIVGETRDDIANLEYDNRTQDEKISWLMSMVESQQQELNRLQLSSQQTELTADVAISMAETALEETQTDSLAPNPSPEVQVSEVVAENPEQTPPPLTDTAQTEPPHESAAESPEAEVGPPILEPVNQLLERKVIML